MAAELFILTLSGAHATGKSTLVDDLLKEIPSRYGRHCAFPVPSCSTRLFERIRAGQVELPEGSSMPESYDDIDTFGLRGWFQLLLPGSLAGELESVALRARDMPQRRVFVLVDRWFPDINAYTTISNLSADEKAKIEAKCRDTHDALVSSVGFGWTRCCISTIFVPLSASTFKVRGQDGKFRATCDRQQFEDLCLANWHRVVPSLPNLTISTPSRRGRVAEVVSLIEDNIARLKLQRTSK